MADRSTQGGDGRGGDGRRDGDGGGRDGGGRDGDGGDGIRTFPFPVDLSVCGVGMQVGPMEPGRTWHADGPIERVHRIDFHVVMLFGDGPVRHMVDFTEYEVLAGELLWIRPGQVHRFSRTEAYRGTVLIMQPGFLPRATVEATGLYRYDLPPLLRPDAAQLAGLTASLAQLEREYVDSTTLPLSLHTSVLRHSLTAFLLRLAHLAADSADSADAARDQDPADTTFTRFREAVEKGFATNHSVSAYADALGYSRRTLVRAVRAATGETPKGFIDKRVVLEAKRLLAHTDMPIGRIGVSVGFPDAANFTKFFHQHTGVAPVAFRAELR
ncbi:AraC family transcriptional regulator [Streptomyces sp. NBC_00878]|uniref:helix-turn-helix transcriptional regulator n=1 Tax=Streptomyces sp. NBC_00878 TaxID=2975854 RepID=UPI0022523A64|nr:AraC family transcriptional regulator [Streptomyces sp. NBC_00878]MCX4903875.1 AraC family transcriptional regulator [Streptomyces sp. NBC_00878]